MKENSTCEKCKRYLRYPNENQEKAALENNNYPCREDSQQWPALNHPEDGSVAIDFSRHKTPDTALPERQVADISFAKPDMT
jgi:hypothetical protein